MIKEKLYIEDSFPQHRSSNRAVHSAQLLIFKKRIHYTIQNKCLSKGALYSFEVRQNSYLDKTPINCCLKKYSDV